MFDSGSLVLSCNSFFRENMAVAGDTIYYSSDMGIKLENKKELSLREELQEEINEWIDF